MARYVKFFGLGGGVDGFITGSCNDIQTTSYLQANGPEANINVAIIPKGTGAIVAACPDGTATGGNARGNYSVDLQKSRTANTQVASGVNSVIVGGQLNTASSTASFVGGGYLNSNSGGYATIVGGNSNTVTGSFQAIVGGISNSITSFFSTGSFIGGGDTNSITAGAGQTNCVISGGLGNVVSSGYSTISGGQSNTASTNTHATVVGGLSNTASGAYSVAGGWANTASGGSSVALGRNCTATNNYSVALGGYTRATGQYSACIGGSFGVGSYATDTYSIALGAYTRSYLYGQLAHSGNDFNKSYGTSGTVGESQISFLNPSKIDTLSSAGTTVLSLDGTGTTNLIIPYGNDRLWAAKITATAFVSAVSGTTLVLGDSYMAEYTVLFKKVGGVSSVVGTNAGSVIADTNMISSAFTFSAGASQELAITFKAPTTANADTFRCVAKVELVEVAY